MSFRDYLHFYSRPGQKSEGCSEPPLDFTLPLNPVSTCRSRQFDALFLSKMCVHLLAGTTWTDWQHPFQYFPFNVDERPSWRRSLHALSPSLLLSLALPIPHSPPFLGPYRSSFTHRASTR